MLRFFSLLLSVVLFFAPLVPTAYCAELPVPYTASDSVIQLPNGMYIVSEICEEENTASLWATNQTKSGSKTNTLYSAGGTKLASVTVRGTFTYNGSTASATNSSYSYSIYDSAWSFSSGSSSYSGATATAKCTFKFLGLSESMTVSLTCSPTGTLS